MSRDYPQMKLRMPPELRDQVEESAKNNGRSMNAEIVHRLEQSFSDGTLVPAGELLSVDEARKKAAAARVSMKETLRKFLIEEVNAAVSRGASEAFADLEDFFDLDDTNDDFTDPISVEVLNPVLDEFKAAGYEVVHVDGLNFFIRF